MKRIFISLCFSLFAFFVVYLLGAFVATSFDVTEWNAIGRFAVALFGGFASLLFFVESICYNPSSG